MYVGGGYIIDAPHTGAVVEKLPESTSWYADSARTAPSARNRSSGSERRRPWQACLARASHAVHSGGHAL